MAGEINTIGTVLKYGATAETVAKLCPIQDYPDLGGAPEMIEVTDLDDDTQRFILGVQSIGAFEFTANYTKTLFTALTANSRTTGFYELEFDTGDAHVWQGQHVVYIVGAGVNAARQMKIVIAPTTKVTPKA